MEYGKLLQRHQKLLKDHAQITEQLKDARGQEQEQLERRLRQVSAEGDTILDIMVAMLDSDPLQNEEQGNRH